MDLHPAKRISDEQALAELSLRIAFARYMEWQPDGDWSTFMSFAKDEGGAYSSPPPAATAIILCGFAGAMGMCKHHEPCPVHATRTPAATATDDDGPHLCVGEWIGGSGGHRTHGAVCGKPALYGRGSLYAYCEEHVKPHERGQDRVPAATASEAELDSPPFKPTALVEFEARGFERVNRHAAATATERGETESRHCLVIGNNCRWFGREKSCTCSCTYCCCARNPTVDRKEPQR